MDKKTRKRSLWLLVIAVAVYCVANFQRAGIPGCIFNELQSDLHATASEVSAMGVAFMYVYALTQLLVGVLLDKYGGARIMTAGAVVFAAGSLLFPLSTTLWMLYLSRMLVGIGAGGLYLSMLKEVDRLMPESFTLLVGVILMTGYSGGIFSGLPFAWAVHQCGWRQILLGIGAVTFVLTLMLVCVFRTTENSEVRSVPLHFTVFFRLLKVRYNWLILLSSGVPFAAYYTLLTVVGKKMLEDAGGLSATAAATCASLMVVFSAGTNMLMGVFSKLLGNRRRNLFRAGLSLSVIGFLLVLATMLGGLPGGVMFAGMLVLAAGSALSPLSASYVRELNLRCNVGSALSFNNFASYILVAVGGSCAGWLLDRFRAGATETADRIIYPQAAYVSVVLLLLAVSVAANVVGWFLPETNGRNIVDPEEP